LAHLQLARVLVNVVDHAGAMQQLKLGRQLKAELEAVLALDPDNTEALKYQESIYRNAPAIFGGDKKKAAQIAARIMQIDPVQGYFLQAEIAGSGAQKATVEELYRKAAEANPKSYDARSRLAYYCLIGAKKFADAESNAREAVRLNPDRIDGYGLLEAALSLQNKWEEVDAVVTSSQAAVPDNLKPYYDAANQMLRKGAELLRAERYLHTYLSQDPELFAPTKAQALHQLGLVFEKEGRPADAAREYEAALKADSSSPAKRELERLQKTQSAPTQPAYLPEDFSTLLRNITAGADSVERAHAITLRLLKLGIPFESRPFTSGGKTGTNIVASLPAPSASAPVIMLGAHMDRVAEGKGAVDNGSGDAAVLELLAAFQRSPLRNSRVVAAFWDLEEQGLIGSQQFISSLPHDQLPTLYINFDMLAYGNVLLANWTEEKSKSAEAFRQAFADQYPLRWDFEFPPSDDRPFIQAGVEVIALALADKQDIENGLKLMRGEDAKPPRILSIMHTAADTPDKVVAADVCRVLPAIERAIRRISEAR
jgi:tetratricopeptide (TPR) repeat protein